MEYKQTHQNLKALQALPLERKILLAQTRYMEFNDRFDGQTYVSFSGGLDSTVMLDIAAQVHKAAYPDETLYVVFVDTGLEFPEIRKFVPEYIDYLRDKYGIKIQLDKPNPIKRFYDVLCEYGYPVISKEVSKIVYGARHSKDSKQSYLNKLDGLNPDFAESEYKQRYKKHKYLLNADFEISNRCCYWMKEKPCIDYERETGRKPVVAIMAADSQQRKDAWLKTGCNAFDGKRPISKPLSIWTTQDVYRYTRDYKLPYCSVYGEVVEEIKISPKRKIQRKTGRLITTGEAHTGCMFCLYGAHLDGAARLRRMKYTHPRQYNYCMYGGEYDNDGLWRPNKKRAGLVSRAGLYRGRRGAAATYFRRLELKTIIPFKLRRRKRIKRPSGRYKPL